MFRPHNRVNLLLGLIAAGWFTVALTFDPRPKPHPVPAEAIEPAPSLEWTVDAGQSMATFSTIVLKKLPAPGANQITDPSKCQPPAKVVQGGCWLAVADEYPPCDPPHGKPRNLWPDNGKCWFPVAPARGAPTSGGGGVPGVANP